MRREKRAVREGILPGDIVCDQRKNLVGKLLELRETPIFKDQIAIVELYDGTRSECVGQSLRKATYAETQMYFEAAGLHILRERVGRFHMGDEPDSRKRISR